MDLGFTELPGIINLFKDKIAFRKRMEGLAPLFYKELEYQDLDKFKVNEIKKPFIIKPAVGFSSLGVRKVNTNEEWEETATSIEKEMEEIQGIYPEEVVNSRKYLIEEYIEGNVFFVKPSTSSGLLEST